MISCAVAGIRMVDALKDTMIMLVPMFLVLALLIVWPDMALLLPRLIEPDFLK
jgi:TRAP-type C4-dicarboxylate transport system permease large subunit